MYTYTRKCIKYDSFYKSITLMLSKQSGIYMYLYKTLITNNYGKLAIILHNGPFTNIKKDTFEYICKGHVVMC